MSARRPLVRTADDELERIRRFDDVVVRLAAPAALAILVVIAVVAVLAA